MSPWWLQPPADGPAKDGKDQPKAHHESSDGDPVAAEPPQAAPESAQSPDPPNRVEEHPAVGRPAARDRRRSGRRRAGKRAGAEGPGAADAVPQRFRRAPSAAEGASSVQSDGEAEPVLLSAVDRGQPATEERRLALFCDLENIALGVRDSEIEKFDITLVLERLLEKGKIIVKRAYADWERYSEFKRSFHEAGIELIDIPRGRDSGKSSADIKMAVDAMELCHSKEHLDTFVVLSGDSDFTPLVSKLKENNKRVIGVGVKNASARLLIDNCDEFILYEDIWRDEQTAPKLDGLDRKTGEALALMIDAIKALMRENKDVLWGSMIKQTMQRKRPSFNEGYYGYGSFSELLEDAERRKLIELKKDLRSGSYIVTGLVVR